MSAGGIRNFPDGCLSNGQSKPWRNYNSKVNTFKYTYFMLTVLLYVHINYRIYLMMIFQAMLNFWEDIVHWAPTWNEEKTKLRIKSVKFTSFDRNQVRIQGGSQEEFQELSPDDVQGMFQSGFQGGNQGGSQGGINRVIQSANVGGFQGGSQGGFNRVIQTGNQGGNQGGFNRVIQTGNQGRRQSGVQGGNQGGLNRVIQGGNQRGINRAIQEGSQGDIEPAVDYSQVIYNVYQ